MTRLNGSTHGPVKAAAAFVAGGALAGSVVFTLLRILQPESFWFVLATAFVPYAVVGYPVAAVLLGYLRRTTAPPLRGWVTGGIVLAVFGTGYHLGLTLPSYLGEHPRGDPDLVVMTLNLHLGTGDAEDAVALVRRQRVQVAVFEEVTPGERRRLLAAGVQELLPHEGGAAGRGAAGTVVFSAFPLSDSARIPLDHGSYRIKVAAPTPFWLVAVHGAQPLVAPGDWRADWDVLNQVVPELDGPVILAGDFNTTVDHAPMRDLLGDRFQDAARTSNAGWQPTWPRGLGLLTIDHVITSAPYAAISTSTYLVDGTDHRALVARLRIS
ncbi:endonuclease/exonuclease/phosphatase family protein [Nocardioides marmoriginsengisoli]|uniref:Endonuclease/exonuclease/phosphatase family protein n=1 Tax=Nocardioides marmoriginsengisoli TaxID=661483 RepID=A0A3N0CPD1_9ACTN|nr:endonuclease/exonuclease/phosphatase family protein [Nocardioides marmoriginsengisoli]RNL65230.1 endonuclease/exonuclease/phosphatase family protein [Nocardioides marmoriginsengisoli]